MHLDVNFATRRGMQPRGYIFNLRSHALIYIYRYMFYVRQKKTNEKPACGVTFSRWLFITDDASFSSFCTTPIFFFFQLFEILIFDANCFLYNKNCAITHVSCMRIVSLHFFFLCNETQGSFYLYPQIIIIIKKVRD